jgi:hypothetical protein
MADGDLESGGGGDSTQAPSSKKPLQRYIWDFAGEFADSSATNPLQVADDPLHFG